MQVIQLLNEKNFGDRAIDIIKSLKDGEGLTKEELSNKLGFTSEDVVDKWMKRYPDIQKHRVYIPVNEGRQRKAVFVNLKYKATLLKTGKVTEKY